MPSLKDLKTRITSVKSTQKITSAMKMVAAAKLRRAQGAAESARPYASRMERMVASLAETMEGFEGAPALLAGSGKSDVHLIVLCTSDRGLCGGFNGSLIRTARRMAAGLESEGKTVKFICVGRKGFDAIKRERPDDVVADFTGLGRRGIEYGEARQVGMRIIELFEENAFDVCTIIFNRFKSAMVQIVTRHQLIPFSATAGEPVGEGEEAGKGEKKDAAGPVAQYIFEPEEEEILGSLLPRNIETQTFQAMLENTASEHGARMTAMDSATRNASDMIDDLSLTFNRTRQAHITRELIEIISGAEAL
jgi:F-type H+-transporting ATPase subunit gamma